MVVVIVTESYTLLAQDSCNQNSVTTSLAISYLTSQARLFSPGSCIHPSFFFRLANWEHVGPEDLDSASPEITLKSTEFTSIRLSDLGQLILALICLKDSNFTSDIRI